jgi:hypothetical protein
MPRYLTFLYRRNEDKADSIKKCLSNAGNRLKREEKK